VSIETTRATTTTTNTPGNGTGQAAGRLPDLTILSQPDSPAAEAYRTLRTNIKFATPAGGSDQPARSILLADTGVGADRPAIAANLAIALAQAGDSTLLIDADLRHPGQHTLFGAANDAGASTFLRGQEGTLPLLATAVPNLSLLTAGPPPPNPAELLAADRFRLLLALAREAAAYTIIDAPPVTAVADALAIAAAADGVLLIVRAGRTRRPAAQRAKEQLLRVGANLLGVILADAKLDRGVYRY
jgi:capsular exopolysaccharide synthesis family protein